MHCSKPAGYDDLLKYFDAFTRDKWVQRVGHFKRSFVHFPAGNHHKAYLSIVVLLKRKLNLSGVEKK